MKAPWPSLEVLRSPYLRTGRALILGSRVVIGTGPRTPLEHAQDDYDRRIRDMFPASLLTGCGYAP